MNPLQPPALPTTTLASPALTPVQDPFLRLRELQAEQLQLEARGFKPDPAKSEADNARDAFHFQDRMRKLILEQLELYTILRKTSAGPARAGGKRAKKAPLDLAALEASVFGD